MWNFPRFAADLFGSGDAADPFGPSPFDPHSSGSGSVFERDYACYPVSFAGRETLEQGNKILLPQSALNTLARMNVQWPMLFELSNTTLDRRSHCGVLEFSAEEGTCYLPYWMMKNLLLEEGAIVKIKSTALPKGTYVKLQPVSSEFLDISDHRAVLEHSLRHFAALTVGDYIVIQHNNIKYEIEIMECKPSDAISIIETDVQVDFAPPKDYVEPLRHPTPATPPVAATLTPETVEGSGRPGSESPPASQGSTTKAGFKVFGGAGTLLATGRTQFASPSTPPQRELSRAEREDLAKEPWERSWRLPGGVRSFCEEYSRLIREGRLPGVIGKTSSASSPPPGAAASNERRRGGGEGSVKLFSGAGFTT